VTEAETRRITFEGSGPFARALVQMLEEEGVTVQVQRGGQPATEYRDARGIAEAVVATLIATGADRAIRGGVQKFRERFANRGAVVRVEGEDDEPPLERGRHRA
jgi:hypothetical protein